MHSVGTFKPFPSKTHYIINDLEQLPRVSTINHFTRIDPKWLDDWNRNHGRVALDLLQQAGEEGTNVHNATELIDQGVTLYQKDYSEVEWICINRYKNFHDRYIKTGEIQYIETEQTLYSKPLGYAGTIDRYCESDGEYFIIDFKTSNNIYLDHWIQQGAYWMLKSNELGESCGSVRLLHLKSSHRTEKPFQGEGWKLYDQPYTNNELYEMFKMKKHFYDMHNKLTSPKLYPTQI